MNASRRMGLGILTLSLALAVLASASRAEDKKKAGSVSGTWKSSFANNKNGKPFEITYKLKQEGEMLTGTATGPRGGEAKIEDGKVKDGKVSFQVTREINDRKFTTKYKGNLSGDTIKGKGEFHEGDQTRSFVWLAKRDKATDKKEK